MRTRGASSGIRNGERASLYVSSAGLAFFLVVAILCQPGVAAGLQRRDSDAGNTLPRSRYLSPVAMQLSPDGRWLYVACEDSDQVVAVDTRTQQVTRRIRVGRMPRGIALSPDGKTLYVSNENDDDVTEIDAQTFQIRRSCARWLGAGRIDDRSHRKISVCGEHAGR